MKFHLLASVFTLAIAVTSAPIFVTVNGQVQMVPNSKTKINLLAAQGGISSFVFDFNNPPAAAIVDQRNSSQVISANGQTFPILGDLDGSMNMFKVGPCGLILPHIHPRANEFVLVTQGEFLTQFITETGSDIISNKLTVNQAAMFPQGSIHYELNPTCGMSTFIGSFNANDPGTLLVTPGLVNLEDSLVINQLGGIVSGEDLDRIRHALPPGPIGQVESCLKACNINKKRGK